MAKHLKVVNTKSEAIDAQKNLEDPYVILVRETNELICADNSNYDAMILVDDWNNYHTELPVDQKDISWIKGKRCLVKKTDDGVAICYLDENNSELFHDGVTEAKLDGSMGQWMVDLPEFNIKCVEGESDWVKLYIGKDKEFGHTSRRVLLGVTEGVRRQGPGYNTLWSVKHNLGSNDDIRSTSNYSLTTVYNEATNLGNNWGIIDYETHCKLAYMFMAKYKSKDPQGMDKFGYGQDSMDRVIGTTSTLGNNDGKTETQISIFGVEDAYGGRNEWMSGIHGNGKTYYIYEGLTLNNPPTVPYRSNELNSIITISSGEEIETFYRYGSISRMEWGEYADLIPTETSGSAKYFYADYGQVGQDGMQGVYRSGSYGESGCGLFYFYCYNPYSSYYSCTSRVQYRGKITVIDNPQEFINLPVGF